MYILSIDTSCDDTSVAILNNDKVLSNIVSSQITLHQKWGGVVPLLAKREHEKNINTCIERAIKYSGIKDINNIDAIAVTRGPGLAPALEVGLNKAKELAITFQKKLIAVNHIEGHIYSCFLKNRNGRFYSAIKKIKFPYLALVISGGHTEILLVKNHLRYKVIGQTLDDAAGEAFDKVARMLKLGYPGGPIIERLAENSDKNKFIFPRPMSESKNFNFSFSGLKTSCLYKSQELSAKYHDKFASLIPDFCAGFQEAVIDSLLIKVTKYIRQNKKNSVLLCGGVASNTRLRKKFYSTCKSLKINLYFPYKKFCTDNAAMIGCIAYYMAREGKFVKNIKKLDRDPSLDIN